MFYLRDVFEDFGGFKKKSCWTVFDNVSYYGLSISTDILYNAAIWKLSEEQYIFFTHLTKFDVVCFRIIWEKLKHVHKLLLKFNNSKPYSTVEKCIYLQQPTCSTNTGSIAIVI